MKSQISKCPICSSKDIKFIFSCHDRLYAIDNKEFPLYQCPDCKLIFLNPMPTQKTISRYYPENYISMNNLNDSRNTTIRLLYDTYYSKRGRRFLKIIFLPVKHLLRSLPVKKNAKFLDIGCGNGRFLKYVKENGMEPWGVDPFINKTIPILNIKKKSLKSADFPDDYFDFVTLNNVLEHTPDPLETLIECKRILKSGGKLIINVPNSNSLNYKIFKKNWVSLDVPRHTFTFSNENLKILSKRLKMKIEKTSYKSESFSIIGSLYYKYSKGNNLNENKQLAKLSINLLFLPYAILNNLLRIGDQIEIILSK